MLTPYKKPDYPSGANYKELGDFETTAKFNWKSERFGPMPPSARKQKKQEEKRTRVFFSRLMQYTKKIIELN